MTRVVLVVGSTCLSKYPKCKSSYRAVEKDPRIYARGVPPPPPYHDGNAENGLRQPLK